MAARSEHAPEKQHPTLDEVPLGEGNLISLTIGAALLASAITAQSDWTRPSLAGDPAPPPQQITAKEVSAPVSATTPAKGGSPADEEDWLFDATPATAPRLAPKFRISQMCASGQLDHKTCKMKWSSMLRQEMLHVTSEQVWNVATNRWIRIALENGPFLRNWFTSVSRFRFGRWNDDNPFLDDYVGHPMMGAISMDIFIQNDPSGMSLELQNTRQYWMSRLRALGWATVYSTQWKVGPLSEASIGNQGITSYHDLDMGGKWTNGTGFAGLVTTPVGGLIWSVGEDAMDKYVVKHLEHVSNNRLWLATISFLTPSRAFANLMRLRSPWYRDSRPVRGRDAVPMVVVAGQSARPEQHGTP